MLGTKVMGFFDFEKAGKMTKKFTGYFPNLTFDIIILINVAVLVGLHIV